MDYTYKRAQQKHTLSICETCENPSILETFCYDCGDCATCCQCPQEDLFGIEDDIEGVACAHCGHDRMWFDCGVCESCEDCCTCEDHS